MHEDGFLFSEFHVHKGEERTEADVIVRIAPFVVAVEVARAVIRAIVEVATNHDRTATPERPPLLMHPIVLLLSELFMFS